MESIDKEYSNYVERQRRLREAREAEEVRQAEQERRAALALQAEEEERRADFERRRAIARRYVTIDSRILCKLVISCSSYRIDVSISNGSTENYFRGRSRLGIFALFTGGALSQLISNTLYRSSELGPR